MYSGTLTAADLAAAEFQRATAQVRAARAARLRAIVAELRAGGMPCTCDLDNWVPEASTGHSWVCQIHKAAYRRLHAELAAN